MSEITCNHCGYKFEEQRDYCPACRSPTPAQQQRDRDAVKRKFMYLVVGLTIFCAIMIVLLPRSTGG